MYQEGQITEKRNWKHITKYMWALCVFSVLVATGLYYKNIFLPQSEIESDIVQAQTERGVVIGGVKDIDRGVLVQDVEDFDLSGTLYLTLVPTDGSRTLNIYSYDINSTKFENLSIANGLNISSKFSPDGERIAFARYGTGGNMQIFAANVATRDFTVVSKNEDSFKREPVWSPDGSQITYVAYEDVNSDKHNPDAWRVYVTSTSPDTSEERFVAWGYNPIFSPDGNSLLILKNEGLFLYDLIGDAEPLEVWGNLGSTDLSAHIHSHMKLSLSHDGKTLAWSDHHRLPKGGLTLFTISSWAPFKMEETKQLNGPSIYSVFSPDDRYLAVEAFDEAHDGKLINARIIVYSLDTFDLKNVLDLKGFDVDLMWLTDWQ